jgi:hypothetical protein
VVSRIGISADVVVLGVVATVVEVVVAMVVGGVTVDVDEIGAAVESTVVAVDDVHATSMNVIAVVATPLLMRRRYPDPAHRSTGLMFLRCST